MYLTIEDGKKIAMPRYYKEKIYSHMERSEISGFQKGEIERRMLEETEQLVKEEKLSEHIRCKKEAIDHSKILMEKNSLKTKI